MKNLDFVIIGAQKSATTSLYKYLSGHPDIFLPADKEAPFFSHDPFYNAGWPAFAKSRFRDGSEQQLWGSVSPQYMYDARVPERIALHMPNLKLIALLRNPIDRAHSHYRMAVRRGEETRPFDLAMEDLRFDFRNPGSERSNGVTGLSQNAPTIDETLCYLEWGQYGRSFEQYYRYFPRNQILTLYMDDLEANPESLVETVLKFIGLDGKFIPANVGKVYHQGGTRRIIPDSFKAAIKSLPLFKRTWRCVPDHMRSAMNYWYEQMNVVRSSSETINPKTRLELAEYFREDIELLQRLLEKPVPWQEFACHSEQGSKK